MRELQAALAKADRQTRGLVRGEFKRVAEPVRRDAEGLARDRIRRVTEPWARMRVGVTRKVVYVAPRQRGVKTRGADPRRRRNFGGLLMARAMEPALQQNQAGIVREVEGMLDRIADDFNH